MNFKSDYITLPTNIKNHLLKTSTGYKTEHKINELDNKINIFIVFHCIAV